ncbi:MAG TPA: homoserine kinase [Acidobacteriaceae bacterium]|jgi:homoserine kinase
MKTVRLQLPATSANLGPGFDALALALDIFLEIDAATAPHFSIEASGRNPEICGELENNLLVETYRSVLEGERRQVSPLAVRVQNGIPLGMGCGSSAAVRLAGVALAAHFGSLGWSEKRIVETAARLEGHPDNVAACWYGGLTIAAGGNERLSTLSISPPSDWRALLVLPTKPVSTAKSRSVIPETYSRGDAVKNIQNVALLTAAFALRQADLLALATQDALHQPFRTQLCPLLPVLLPLAGRRGVLSVTLSGAGPAVLLLCSGDLSPVAQEIVERSKALGPVEVLEAGLWGEGAVTTSSL